MSRRISLLLLLLLFFSCKEDAGTDVGIPSATASESLARQREATEQIERGVAALGESWRDALQLQLAAQEHYRAAEVKYLESQRASGASAQVSLEAKAIFESAAQRWRFYQALVVVAAALDARNLDQFRQATGAQHVSSLDCNAGVSTAAFRAMLVAQGVNLEGRDVDHIVPRSLGGADHPANYQLLPSSVNRSLGNTWNPEKCAATGGKCAGAVAISKKCGSFRGSLP